MRTACEFQESSAERKEDLRCARQGGNIPWHVARISVMERYVLCPPLACGTPQGGQLAATATAHQQQFQCMTSHHDLLYLFFQKCDSFFPYPKGLYVKQK